MNIIKIDDKNFKVVNSNEVIYNLDELEKQLEYTIEYNIEQNRILEEIKQLPKYLQNLFAPLPYQDEEYLQELINKLKSL